MGTIYEIGGRVAQKIDRNLRKDLCCNRVYWKFLNPQFIVQSRYFKSTSPSRSALNSHLLSMQICICRPMASDSI